MTKNILTNSAVRYNVTFAKQHSSITGILFRCFGEYSIKSYD